MTNRSYTNGKPRVYGAEKRPMLQTRLGDERIMAPMRAAKAVMFPDVPVSAVLGFTSFSTSPRENTTEAVVAQRFHEMGLFQVEGGPRSGPAPNPDPRASSNTYGRLAASSVVKSALHNTAGATMVHNAWKEPAHWADQVAVGMAGLLDHGAQMARALRAPIVPRDSSSNWYWMTLVTGFSRGTGQASKVFNAYAAELASIPEADRWKALRTAVARDIRTGTGQSIAHVAGKLGAAYALARTEQKFESGYAVSNNEERSWHRSHYLSNATEDEIEDTITRKAYSVSASSIVTDTGSAIVDTAGIVTDTVQEHPYTVAIIVGVLALAGGVWYVTKDDWY